LVKGYLSEENIDDLARLSRVAILEAAPEISDALALDLSTVLSDLARGELPEATWEEFVKELQAGAAAAAELGELLAPLMETL
jgi:hypothetical protein